MGPTMRRLLLLSIVTVLFMKEDIRFCHKCNNFNGMECRSRMKSCWKFNVMAGNRSCTTDHFYYYDRFLGKYLYRYSVLSCRACEEGMFQVFHDLLRETHCCTHENRCNDGNSLEEKTKIFGLDGKESIYDTEKISYK
ncbi:hypothetical protein CB1_000154005 [Camelus ferus]|nr:hypothetical protein CB1_000154005 [Camelus ferus]